MLREGREKITFGGVKTTNWKSVLFTDTASLTWPLMLHDRPSAVFLLNRYEERKLTKKNFRTTDQTRTIVWSEARI